MKPRATSRLKESAMLTVADVADHLGVCSKTVRRFVVTADLRVHRVGRLIRIHQDDLATFIALRRV